MARQPRSPSDKIVKSSRPFGPHGAGSASATPEVGDGKPGIPQPVKLTHSESAALAEEFSSEVEMQYEENVNLRQQIDENLKIYRGKAKESSKDYPLAHASNVVVKIAKIYTDQVVARMLQSIFDPKPFWIMQELNKQFAGAVKPYERYMDWCRQNLWNQRRVIEPFVQEVVKLGTGILYNDFVNQPLFRYDAQNQQTVQTGTRKGPQPANVLREDFLIPKGFSDIQQAPYIAHRCWFSWDQLERMAYQGFVENLEDLKAESDDLDDIKMERANNQPMVETMPDSRFGLWAPWYVWFRRDLDKDGWPEEYVMLLHPKTKKILRFVPNPSPSGMRPYCVAKYTAVEGEFDGIGIPEDVADLQEEASTIHNQRRDRAHLANIVMYVARMTANVTDTIRPASGKVIKVTDVNDIKEFHPSTNVPIDIAEEDSVMRLAALLVGMNDVDMGKASSPVGRAAATTIMALMQEGTRRFDLNVSRMREALTEQGHQITELWQTYGLPDPEDPASPENIIDQEDAQAVRQMLEQPISLRGMVSIQMNVATAAINKEIEKQSNMQLYQTTSQYLMQMLQLAPVLANPQVPPELKAATIHVIEGQDKLLKEIFQSYNKFDLESVLAGDLFEQIAEKSIQMQQQAQAMGAPPPGSQPPGAPGQPPPNGAAGAPQPPAKPVKQPQAAPQQPPWQSGG